MIDVREMYMEEADRIEEELEERLGRRPTRAEVDRANAAIPDRVRGRLADLADRARDEEKER